MPRGIAITGDKETAALFEKARKAFVNPEHIKDALMPAAKNTRNVAEAIAPVGLGLKPDRKTRRLHLKELIFAARGRRGDPSVIVGVDRKKAPHANIIETGAAAHLIKPRTPNKFLHLFGKVFARRVHHPGARKQPFMRPAANATRGSNAEIINQSLRKLLNETVPGAGK